MYSSLKKSYPVLENYRGGGGFGGGEAGRGGGFGGGAGALSMGGGAEAHFGGTGRGVPIGAGLPMSAAAGIPIGSGSRGLRRPGHFSGAGHTPIHPIGPGGHRDYPYFAYGQNGYGGYGNYGYYPNTYNYTTVNNNNTCFCQDTDLVNNVPMQYQICPKDTTDCGVCIPTLKCKNCNNNYSC
jgi:hypothetical protein